MCGLFWGAHKSLAPRARTLLGGLGEAKLSFFAVATLLFVFFGECPKFCDLAKQRRKIVGPQAGVPGAAGVEQGHLAVAPPEMIGGLLLAMAAVEVPTRTGPRCAPSACYPC